MDCIKELGDIFKTNKEQEMSQMDRLSHTSSEQKVLNNWEDISRPHSGKQYINGEDILDAFWQTLSVGLMHQGFDVAKEEFREWDDSVRSKFRHLPLGYLNTSNKLIRHAIVLPFVVPLGVSLVRNGTDVSNLMRFRQKTTTIAQRRFFKTETGYIGLAPEQARKGDRMGLFPGSKVPLVVRAENGRWRLIGDCYVHGMMHGEAFLPERCERMWIV